MSQQLLQSTSKATPKPCPKTLIRPLIPNPPPVGNLQLSQLPSLLMQLHLASQAILQVLDCGSMMVPIFLLGGSSMVILAEEFSHERDSLLTWGIH